MKKILLSLASALTVTGMYATPTLTPQYTGSIAAAQESPSYSNPSAYDTHGGLIVTGAFDGSLDEFDAVGTSAFISKYSADNSKAWTVALIGAATITSVATDAQDNIYVAGRFADEVEFVSTNGLNQTKTGLVMNGEPTEKKNASFLAKYKADGVLEAVRTFVPEALPELMATGMYYPEDGDFYFAVNDVKVDGEKVYVSASFKGVTEIDGEKFSGTYQDPWGGVFFIDLANAAVLSLDAKTLNTCKNEASFSIDGPVYADEAPAVSNISFAVSAGNVYSAAILSGVGNINAVNGSFSEAFTGSANSIEYIVTGASGSGSLATSSGESINPRYNIADMMVSGEKVYMVGTTDYAEPKYTVDESINKVTGLSDIFVASFSTSDLKPSAVNMFKHDEGVSSITASDNTTEDKPNYEMAHSVALVNDALYINTCIYNFNEEFISLASYWYDVNSFSDAPVAATGIAVGDGSLALTVSDAAKVDYSTFKFTTAGINDIDVDDADAPVEYFNIQGVRVANPDNGIFIRRQDNKVEKVIVK